MYIRKSMSFKNNLYKVIFLMNNVYYVIEDTDDVNRMSM